jgi:Core-2/I-Branching enzyme
MCVQVVCGSRAWHECVADEHYVATVLKVYDFGDTLGGFNLPGQEHVCLTYTEFPQEASWHPRTFGSEVHVVETLAAMRMSSQPGYAHH